jgi:hypothetical protein
MLAIAYYAYGTLQGAEVSQTAFLDTNHTTELWDMSVCVVT